MASENYFCYTCNQPIPSTKGSKQPDNHIKSHHLKNESCQIWYPGDIVRTHYPDLQPLEKADEDPNVTVRRTTRPPKPKAQK